MHATLARAFVGTSARSLVVLLATVAAANAQSGPAANPGERGGAKPAGATPTPPAAPIKPTIDVTTTLTPGAPVLVTIARSAKRKSTATVAGKKVETSEDRVEEIQLVDTIVEAKKGSWKAHRHYVKSFTTVGEQVRDDELNGIDLDLTYSSSRQLAVDVTGGRLVFKPHLARIEVESLAPCLYVDVPSSLSVGDDVTVNVGPIVPLLLDTGGVADDNEVKLHFARFDANSKIATFEGAAKLKERADAATFDLPEGSAVEGAFLFDGTMALDVDVDAHRVAKTTLNGHVTFDGKLKTAPVSLKAEVSVTASAATAGADKAAAAPPTFRDVAHEVSGTGVSFALPSHWFELPATAGWNAAFQSSLDGAKNVAFVQIRVADRTGDFAAFAKEFEAGLARDAGKVAAAKDVTCKLGAGKQWTFEKDGTKTTVEVYPVGEKSSAIVRVQATTARFATALADFEKARAALKLAPPH